MFNLSTIFSTPHLPRRVIFPGKTLSTFVKTILTLEKTVSTLENSVSTFVFSPTGGGYRTWDEFQPNLYELTAELDTRCGTDVCREDFGLRRLGTDGTQITVNGRPVFLRGTQECCIFPKTGYPPTDKAEWLRIMNICRAHGLNHIRFHSWCPPEAAFCAADETGMYLYVECGAWAHDIGSGLPVDSFVMEESRRIVREYGNHPSFCLFSYGNEPGGKKMTEYLRNWVNYWKAADSVSSIRQPRAGRPLPRATGSVCPHRAFRAGARDCAASSMAVGRRPITTGARGYRKRSLR